MRPLWNHQVRAIQRAHEVNNFGLLFEMGTGKSRAAIEILRRKYHKEGRLLRTLILAPIAVCENWRREFKMFSKINDADIQVLTQTGAKRVKEFIRWAGDDLKRPKVFVTNYHATQMKDLYELMIRYNFEALIIDESQRVKNPTGKMSLAVARISDNIKYKLILTGTPILNSPMDLFMQWRILDGGETFGKNFYGFRAAYCEDKNSKRAGTQGYFPKWEVRENMYSVIQDKIASRSMRVMKSECLDLPPLVRQEMDVEMSAEQKKLYNEMLKEYLAYVDDPERVEQPRTITAQIAATKALRLQQICSGYAAITQTGDEHQLKDVPRLSVLGELLEDLTPNHKVIVWAIFKQNYKMISKLCDKLGLKYVTLTGDDNIKAKNENMDVFQKDPSVRVMIANQSAGGVGVNLTAASYAIYYSKGFSLEADLQSEARNHRGGSEIHEKITRIDLICRGSIDELITEALQKKQDVAEHILKFRERL